VTYHRVVYKPAGYWPRSFVILDMHEERHGRDLWVVGKQAVTEEPLYLLRSDVRQVKKLT